MISIVLHISNNRERFDKVLRTQAQAGEKIGYAQLADADQEARWTVHKIQERLKRDPESRIAVLYRTIAQSRSFEEACRRAGLRYNLVGGFSFYERAEIKDIVCYLRLALNPTDAIALARVINTPSRGIGKATLDEIESTAKLSNSSHWHAISTVIDEEKLGSRAISALKSFREIMRKLSDVVKTEGMPVAEVVKAAIIDTGYERSLKEENNDEALGRLLNLEELVNAAAESDTQGETLRDFLDHAALVADTDEYTGAAQVTLMTMHSAKGLEFPVVFIAGLEENLFPNSRTKSTDEDIEEERRLCYVAITRAERFLYLTHAERRRVYGDEYLTEPSRFLNEFPQELIQDLTVGSSWLYHGSSMSTEMGTREPAGERNKPRSNYQGPTYNSADEVRNFFAKKGKQVDAKAFRSRPAPTSGTSGSGEYREGMRVRHAQYGMGLIVRCEGEGDGLKLTVSFPGYGMKKLIEKHAKLQRVE